MDGARICEDLNASTAHNSPIKTRQGGSAWKEVVENRRRYKGLLYKGKAFFDRINETNKRIKSSFVLKLAHTMCNYPITSLF